MQISAKKAFENANANEYSRWSVLWNQEESVSSHPNHAVNRLKDRFFDPVTTLKLELSKGSNFFCIGSCFAREIEDSLTVHGVNAATKTRFIARDLIRDFRIRQPHTGRPYAFLNRYNAPSMLLEMENILGASELGGDLLYGTDEKVQDAHYTPLFDELNYEQTLSRRNLVRSIYQQCFDDSNVFVFTFGLCEAFFDTRAGKYANITPNPRRINDDLAFRWIGFEENKEVVVKLIKLITVEKPSARIILTVSPVPLDVTFTTEDVILANMRAKSTLHAAVTETCSMFDNVFYFPSFEMVLNSETNAAWKWDRKHVGDDMVNAIVGKFVKENIKW